MACELEIPTPAAMGELGRRLATRIGAGEALCLSGPLGAGKSTLARGLIRALAGADTEVPSPTFTLVQFYETGGSVLAHFDLYRLRSAEEVFELGVGEALDEGPVIIEWPERLGEGRPADRLDVLITPTAGDTRRVRIEGFGTLGGRAEF